VKKSKKDIISIWISAIKKGIKAQDVIDLIDSTYPEESKSTPVTPGSGDVTGPATNTDGYIPQWDGANSKTLKNGLAVPAGGLAGLTALGDKVDKSAGKSLVSDTEIAKIHASGSDAETAITIATINHGTAEKTAIVDADEITGQDSANSFSLIRTTWTNVKAFLKTYFDTLYSAIGHNHSGVYQPAGTYSTDIHSNITALNAVSGTNTGDNATNSQYSGLATSKQDALVSGTNIKTINGNNLLGSGDLVITGSVPVSWGRYF